MKWYNWIPVSHPVPKPNKWKQKPLLKGLKLFLVISWRYWRPRKGRTLLLSRVPVTQETALITDRWYCGGLNVTTPRYPKEMALLGSVALLEEVPLWRPALGSHIYPNHTQGFSSLPAACLSGYRIQLQHHVCLSATLFPSMMVLVKILKL